MSELLSNICGPSLISTFPHSFGQQDWYQRHPISPTVSAPSSLNPTKDSRTASDPHVTYLLVGGHDHDTLTAANQPLTLSREPLPWVEAPKDTHVDDAVVSADDQL